MENFISVGLPSRKAKKAVLEKMIAAAQMHLNETNPNYGIFAVSYTHLRAHET